MPDNSLSGKLAVILHADIVGSTTLVQQDEQKSHARIQESFRRFGKTILSYHGQVSELRGDALLAEFDRASDAVSAALAFQSEQSDYNRQFDDNIRPLLRVGIALGEVVIADGTITGAGVVLAQRLEQLAEPGSLCITPAIREALPQRLPFKLESLGARQLKGFDEPIEVYRVELVPGTSVPAPETRRQDRLAAAPSRRRIAVAAVVLGVVAAAGVGLLSWQLQERIRPETQISISPDKPSIAVLPFDNMSGDPEQEYFSDGITEDLTTDLSRISGLFVVARNSSFSYKGKSVDVRTVAQELGVRYVLEGSVRRSGDRIRINAQLADGSSGVQLWAERFDGSLADVFALQDHVNRRIVSALEVSLTLDEKRVMEQVETDSPEAYDLVLLGLEQFSRFTRQSNFAARELFKQAATVDPGYARAYANISMTYGSDILFYWTKDRKNSISLGLEFANKALAIDDNLVQGHQSRSMLYLMSREHHLALEEAKKTIQLHPGYVDGQATLAFIQSYSGLPGEALESLQRARKNNPRNTGVYLEIEGRSLFLLGRYDEASQVLEVAVQRNPAVDRIHLLLAATYAELGRLEDAAWSIDEALSINPEISLANERREAIYLREIDLNLHIGALRKAGLS
jgi:adenylate cyclase